MEEQAQAAQASRSASTGAREFQLTLQHAPIGMCTVGLDGSFLMVNKALCRIVGYSQAELLALDFQTITHPDDLEADLGLLQAVLRGDRNSYKMEKRYIRKDGVVVWIQLTVALIRDDDGAPLHFISQIEDITERKQAETELREVNETLSAILAASPQAVYSLDAEGRVRSFNAAAERMLWYPADAVIGRLDVTALHDVCELTGVTDESSCGALEQVLGVAQRGQVQRHDCSLIRGDGTRVPAAVAYACMRDAAGAITGYVGVASDMTERQRREEYTRHIAQHDHLTGLPNRMLLDDRIERAIVQARRFDHSLAVLMLDLDNFKRINDSLGHHIGDGLLRVIADRLRDAVRATDTVARMGGDEFVVLLDQVEASQRAVSIANNIVDVLSRAVEVSGHELVATPSIGVAMFPADGLTPVTLIRNADAAMYRAKQEGRCRVVQFDKALAQQAYERIALESGLREAITRDQLVLHYQPQVDLGTGQLRGFEALLRWSSPTLGTVSPESFIPVAEEANLIATIGRWVLTRACREFAAFQAQAPLLAQGVKLAINLSARQFEHPGLVDDVANALRTAGLAPDDVELEITESVIMKDTNAAAVTLEALAALGVRIAIDDFGTGFSSLAYITRLPIRTLKIDQSFVHNADVSERDAAVIEVIRNMAACLDFDLIAEGVESEQQLAAVTALRCQSIQGFLIGPGRPLSDYVRTGIPRLPGVVNVH